MTALMKAAALLLTLMLIGAACASDSSTLSDAADTGASVSVVEADPEGEDPVDDAEEPDAASEPITDETPEQPVTVDDSSDDALRTGSAAGEATFGEDFPDIIAVQATQDDSGSWRFDVTVSSPYDTPQRYADAWRVIDPDGNELGIRVLAHDHANEQPFTRSQTGIEIADDISEVTVQGRDRSNGWGGGELVVALG